MGHTRLSLIATTAVTVVVAVMLGVLIPVLSDRASFGRGNSADYIWISPTPTLSDTASLARDTVTATPIPLPPVAPTATPTLPPTATPTPAVVEAASTPEETLSAEATATLESGADGETAATPVESSSPAAGPAAGDEVMVTVAIVAGLNVRATPTQAGEIVSVLPNGSTLVASGRSGDSSWLQVVLNVQESSQGWISAQFVTVTGDLNRLPVVVE